MAEVKEFRHLLEQIQQMPDTQNLGQSQECWEEMEQKSQWIGQLAEQIFQKYSGSFVTPRIPESDPPAPILQAALEYMNNQKNYSSLLQPGLFRKVQHDRRAPVMRFVALRHLELRRAAALPVHRPAALLVGARDDLDLVRNHERRVESQSEVPDDRLILVFGHELLGP